MCAPGRRHSGQGSSSVLAQRLLHNSTQLPEDCVQTSMLA